MGRSLRATAPKRPDITVGSASRSFTVAVPPPGDDAACKKARAALEKAQKKLDKARAKVKAANAGVADAC